VAEPPLPVGYHRPTGDLPEGWTLLRLGEVAEVLSGGTLRFTKESDYAPTGFPAFSAAGPDGFVPEFEYDREAVVVPSIGSIGRAYATAGRWTSLGNTQVILPNPERLDHRFLAHRLDGFDFWPTNGTAQPYIRTADMPRCWLALPPLAEQRRIADASDTIDAAIHAAEDVADAKERVLTGLREELMTHGIGDQALHTTPLGELPAAWRVEPLGAHITLINGRSFKRDELKDAGRARVIRIQNLSGGESWHWTDLELPERQYCDRGDLLYTWSGTFGPHRWEGERAIFHYHIWRVIPGRSLEPDFTFALLQHLTARIRARSQGGLTMLHATKSAMESQLIPIPPRTEQEAIHEALSSVGESLGAERARVAQLRRVKAGRIQTWMRGER
jgi:type I restriction enzyme S subunit